MKITKFRGLVEVHYKGTSWLVAPARVKYAIEQLILIKEGKKNG